MRYIITLLLALSLASCGVYQVSTTPKIKITKVLTITSTGDTLAVPIKQFQKYNYNNVFDNYRFTPSWNWNYWNYPYYGYGWNNLYRPNSWYYRDFYYQPPMYNLSTELPIKLQKPRVYVNGRRGSNNIIVTPNGVRNNNNSRSNYNNTNIRQVNPNPNNNRIYLRQPNNNNINTRPSISRPNISKGNNFTPPRTSNNSTSSSGRGNINRRN